MLKFREGKLMVFVMVMIFAVTCASVLLMDRYQDNGYYKFAIWFFMIDLVILALCQIYLARKLYRIAKEISQVSSKTGNVNESAVESD